MGVFYFVILFPNFCRVKIISSLNCFLIIIIIINTAKSKRNKHPFSLTSTRVSLAPARTSKLKLRYVLSISLNLLTTVLIFGIFSIRVLPIFFKSNK